MQYSQKQMKPEYGLGSKNWPQERTVSARTSDPPMVTEMGISHMQATAVTLRFQPSVYITKRQRDSFGTRPKKMRISQRLFIRV